MFVSVLRHTKAAAAAAALQTVLALLAGAEPRPINEPEREAVAIVAAFLSRGPLALEERLAPDAALRALPREDVLTELAVRTGPREGARWTLQTAGSGAGDVAFRVTFPSGYEDGLLFRMTKTGQRWSLREVLTLAENPVPPASPSPPASSRRRFPPRTILIVAAFLLGVLAAISFARSRVLAVIALVFAAIAAAAAILIPRFAHVRSERASMRRVAFSSPVARGAGTRKIRSSARHLSAAARTWHVCDSASGATVHRSRQCNDPWPD